MFLSSLFPNPPGQTPALLARRAERIEGKGTKEEENRFFFIQLGPRVSSSLRVRHGFLH